MKKIPALVAISLAASSILLDFPKVVNDAAATAHYRHLPPDQRATADTDRARAHHTAHTSQTPAK